MAFGDKGRFRFSVRGVPFRVDGESAEQAAQVLQAALESGEASVEARAKRLGLTPRDADVLRARSERATQQRASGHEADPDAAVRGVTNVDEALEGVGLAPVSGYANTRGAPGAGIARMARDAGFDPRIPIPDALARFMIGAGRFSQSRVRGVQQIVGDPAREQELAQEARTEQGIYDQFGAGLGVEDVGEAFIPALAFYATGGLTGGSILAAGGTGAALNATEEQTDPSAANRALSGTVGALEGMAGQAIGNSLFKPLSGLGAANTAANRGFIQRLLSVPRGQSFGAGGPRIYTNFLAFFKGNKPSAVNAGLEGTTAEAVEIAAKEAAARAAYQGGQEQLRTRVGRAVLDKVEEGIRSLPQTARAGATAAVERGFFQGALKSAIDDVDGVPVINPAKWQIAMTATVGRLGSMFRRPAHARMVVDMNSLVRAMAEQRAGGIAFTEESVNAAVAALQKAALGGGDDAAAAALRSAGVGSAAAAEAEAVQAALAALKSAPAGSEAQRTLIQAIIDRGRMASGALGERGAEETGDYAESTTRSVADKFDQWAN